MHEPEYLKAIEEVFQTVQRADEVLYGLESFISRRAEVGMACVGYPPEFGTWLSTLLPNDCRVRVLYTYTKEVAFPSRRVGGVRVIRRSLLPLNPH